MYNQNLATKYGPLTCGDKKVLSNGPQITPDQSKANSHKICFDTNRVVFGLILAFKAGARAAPAINYKESKLKFWFNYKDKSPSNDLN